MKQTESKHQGTTVSNHLIKVTRKMADHVCIATMSRNSHFNTIHYNKYDAIKRFLCTVIHKTHQLCMTNVSERIKT